MNRCSARWARAFTTALGFLILAIASVSAQVTVLQDGQPMDARSVGIDQKLNAQVPLDAVFTDDTGKTVRLGDYFGKKPVILNMIFYKCTGSCLLESEGMVAAFKEINFTIGNEFNVVTISINPKETPKVAADKKEGYVQAYGRPPAASGWLFLTGGLAPIKRVAEAVGFRYVYNPKTSQIAHATGIMVCTPQGRVSRYFLGAQYEPRDLRLALVEASENKIGTLTDRIVLYCSQFDTMQSRYGLAFMRVMQVAGVLTVLILGISVFLMSRRYQRHALTIPTQADPHGPLPLA